MSLFSIPVSVEDRKVLAATIANLDDIRHINKMTYDMLAQGTHFKPSKVRNVLQAMLDNGEVIQYDAPSNSNAKRYLYFLTEAGKQLLVSKP